MEYLIVISIILIYSSVLTLISKKNIEQTIPIAVVSIILTIYIAGLFDNLRLGIKIVEIMAILGIAIICYFLCKQKENKNVKEILARILTPGAILYVVLSVLFIFINKGRVFEDYDEFNHWARIIKNMFLYNTYGVNEESIVVFNEYPPFTAVFQFLFLGIKNVYREDTILIAQNILYLSIIIPITKNIKWGKTLKNLIIIIPAVIFIPMFFYKNFYLDILVDGILGVIFGILIFTAYDEKDINYKYIKIFSLLIMLTLTKTSGIALAVLALLIIIIKKIIEKNITKKEIRNILIVILLTLILTSAWYIKTKQTVKRWEFNQYVETLNKNAEDKLQIAKKFIRALVFRNDITYKEITVLIAYLILICINFYSLRKAKEQKDKNYKYYSIAMLITIPIYMMFLLFTYTTIFDMSEAKYLTCFDRYSGTILLANVIFQLLAIISFNKEINFKKVVIMFTIIISLLPYENIVDKYIEGKNYIVVSNINRDIYTKFRLYSENIDENSKILYITGEKDNAPKIRSLNEYVSNTFITEAIIGDFKNSQELEKIAKEYDYIFIYRMSKDAKENVKDMFKDNGIKNDTLYKVIQNDENIFFEKQEKKNER